MPSLAVVAGPWSGSVLALDRPHTVLGRSASCDLVVPDPDMSRRHAVVSVDGDRAWVADLGSSNGTWVDGRRVPLRPVPLPPGALLRVGESTALLELDAGRRGDDPVGAARGGPPGGLVVHLGRTHAGAPVAVDLARGGLGLLGPDSAIVPTARWAAAQCGLSVRLVGSARGRWRHVPDRPDGRVLLIDLGAEEPTPDQLALLSRDPCPPALVIGGRAAMACPAVARVTSDTGTRMRLGDGPEFVRDGVDDRWLAVVAARWAQSSSSSGPIS